ncbi:hypothetical protein Glove_180g92 [Diversispora epigaea]|uniref:HMG box domain-containing protein n=1 Tax=Diversispora epigaea TaxID=1348612 RepID=A0A397INA1_9GLOM|nr:hypothetical protein Glove_180g92 [Diversispora epigaea]
MSNRKTTLVKKNQSRACVFIDSSDPSLPNQVINDARPFIKLPFPPTIDPRDLITILPDGRVPTRAPNAFIIYRRAFIEAARAEGYNLPMTVISSMTSQSWEQEPNFVKAEYRRLGKEAYNRRNEMCPDSNQRRKREKWNMVSFGNKKNSRKIKKSMRKSKKQSSLSYCDQSNKIQQEKKFQQSPPSPVPSFSSDSSESDSVVDYKVVFTPEMINNNDNDNNNSHLEDEEALDYQELYSSSERDSHDYYPTPKDTTTFTETTSNSPDMNKSDYRCEFPFVAPENFSEEFLPSPIHSPIDEFEHTFESTALYNNVYTLNHDELYEYTTTTANTATTASTSNATAANTTTTNISDDSPSSPSTVGIYDNLYTTTDVSQTDVFSGFSDSDELSNYSPELSPVIFADNSGTTIFQDLSGNYYYY